MQYRCKNCNKLLAKGEGQLVSTHSRLKAAGVRPRAIVMVLCMFQHTAA